MDWEKQDNELRQLLEGADFLPDEERWNSVDSWMKLQQKRQPAKKGLLGYWMLAAAACVVGMLGFGLWWMQKDNSTIENNNVVKGKEIENSNGVKLEAFEHSNVQLKPITTVNPDNENRNKDFNKKTQSLNNDVKQNSDKNIFQSLVNNEPESKMLHNKEDETIAVIESKNEIDSNRANEVITTTSTQATKSDITSTTPVKKPKIRVVHYNELNGMRATEPPVFVLIKKSEVDWEALAVQNVTTQRAQPYSLKIDISPAPKKSL